MKPCPIPGNEQSRLKTLAMYGILDTPAEENFDGITELLSALCQTPIAVISLVDKNRQWFKSSIGLDVQETPRDMAFCAHAIMSSEMMIVEDASADQRFQTNPLVTGEPFIRFYAGAPLITPDGHALGTLCVIDSEPRRLQPEQKRHLRLLANLVEAQLELRLKVHNLEQSQTQLNRAQHQLQLANAHKSIFLAKMSHEMRTPLNAIVGFSRRLNRRLESLPLPVYVEEGLTAIETSAKHLRLLVDNLFNLTHLEPVQEEQIFDLPALLDELMTTSASKGKMRNLIFEQQIQLDGGHHFWGAPEKIRQALLNLIGNAIRFSKEGGLITIRASYPSSHLTLAVIDRGVGMTPEQLARLFLPFQQLDNQLDSSYSGAGIGLSISKHLVEAMGGTLDVSSTLGQGSHFVMVLPLRQADEPKPNQRP